MTHYRTTTMDELRSSSFESSSNYFRLPHLYALIIGINTYASPDWSDLTCAVQDADDFEHYLVTRLHVFQSNIINLRNEAATRSAILGAFKTLKDLTFLPLKSRHSIDAEDMGIIIFFAGHGTRGKKPEEWKDWVTFDDYYEALCPADMGLKQTDKSDMCEIPAIPDRTIAALVNQLSDIRGNNITLIFDCCHSAGTNRGGTEADREGYIPRYVSKPPRLPFDYDDGIIGSPSRGRGAAYQGVFGKNQSSHVLLAACGREERAYEHPARNNGVFTYALLKVLNEVNVETMTYTSLMHRLRMPVWQNAHCDGVEVNRRLFNHRIKGGDPSLIPGLKVDGHLKMDAGIVQGVTVGSVVEIHGSNLYSIQQQPNIPFTTLVVTKVDDNSSTLELPESLINVLPPRCRLYCRVIQRPSNFLSISSNDMTWLESVYTEKFCTAHSVSIVQETNAADLELTLKGDTVFIDHHFPLAANHLGTRSPFKIQSNDTQILHNLVQHAIHFRYHLLRTNPNSISSQTKDNDHDDPGGGGIKVTIDMRELCQKSTLQYKSKSIIEPIGANVFEKDPGVVIVDEDKMYGVIIENLTDLPLYPHLFYFDPSELSITSWYSPPIGAGPPTHTPKTDIIFHPKSKFSIGYSEDGLDPWNFYIRPGETKDVGFFKLFLTTTPSNLNNIVQESAYSPPSITRSDSIKREQEQQEQRRRQASNESEIKDEVWDTVVMTVVQFEAGETVSNSKESCT